MVMITPVILSGGAGTRLWPMSTADRPKQFLPLVGIETMFEATLARVADAGQFADPIIVANARHEALVRDQLGGRPARIILEPAARNTAPAIALAALLDPHATLLVMPSDHVIADVTAFHAAVQAALPLVAQGWLITFGIAPDAPETGYGYIQVGDALATGVHKVARFVEKPDVARAAQMIADGDHAWNGGIFLFQAQAFLGALSVHAPDMLHACQRAMDGARHEGSTIHPDAEGFMASPADSIDYAVMEKAAKEEQGSVAVVPVSMGWSDVGSWDALAALAGDTGGDTNIFTHDAAN
ncbi:MAG: mannose-1-phosphate guanylyltransferase, partial [Alphaproteobacteria bacterium]|nr:mannose-1-phosphate guanylyltransferase [Alphaproteobacteria bacterium]